MALNSIFLKIHVAGKAIKGEVQTVGYEGQIEVDSFTWKLEPAVVKGEANQRARAPIKGKPISVNKLYDEATGNLMLACDERKPFSTARFTMVNMELVGNAGKTLKVMELLLTDGYIEAVDLKASESSKAISIKETVTLSYKKCDLMYYPPDPSTGRRGAPMTYQLKLPEVDD